MIQNNRTNSKSFLNSQFNDNNNTKIFIPNKSKAEVEEQIFSHFQFKIKFN